MKNILMLTNLLLFTACSDSFNVGDDVTYKSRSDCGDKIVSIDNSKKEIVAATIIGRKQTYKFEDLKKCTPSKEDLEVKQQTSPRQGF